MHRSEDPLNALLPNEIVVKLGKSIIYYIQFEYRWERVHEFPWKNHRLLWLSAVWAVLMCYSEEQWLRVTENDCKCVKQLSSISILVNLAFSLMVNSLTLEKQPSLMLMDTKDGLSVIRTILVLVKQLDPIVTLVRDVKCSITSSDTELKLSFPSVIVLKAGLSLILTFFVFSKQFDPIEILVKEGKCSIFSSDTHLKQ